ncbi:MAG TPA: M20 family metallopeptidase [Longimicrobiales bacterium]|nr:M20 family metallopeptidase [Longimicrobiales bacterium]
MRDFLHHARSIQADLVALRRDLHRHPELSFREVRTAGVAADAVEHAGLDVRRGVGGTGVVAELRTGDGPVVVLRADMDALPIREANDVEYRSTVDGAMHACGHDAHTAMLVGAARLLAAGAEAGELPAGTVRLLFQPAEEKADADNRSGAVHLVEAGAMEGVSAAFALHVGPHLPAGKIFTREGAIMAGSDTFTAHVIGESSHGARPEEGVDALVLAAHVILAAQLGVARRISPMQQGVLTIGTVRGGAAENVIADRVSMDGTLRYFDPDVRRRLRAALEGALGVAESLGGRTELELREGYPPTINDGPLAALAMDAARDLLGEDGVWDAEPMMGTEDFAVLLRQAPGALLWLGAAPPDRPRELHRPDMDIDESVLPIGAAVLAACAARALERR